MNSSYCDWGVQSGVGGDEWFAFFGVGGSSAFFSCALLVNVIVLLFLATVFYGAEAFNGDLNQWDVAKVTSFNWEWSKSIRIVENDLT